MFDLGFQELIVIFLVALLVFGPRRLPELARTLGKGMGDLKRAFSGVKTEFEREVHQAELEKLGRELSEKGRSVRNAMAEEVKKVTGPAESQGEKEGEEADGRSGD